MDAPQELARGAEIRARHGLGLRLGGRDSVYNGGCIDRPVDDLGLGVVIGDNKMLTLRNLSWGLEIE